MVGDVGLVWPSEAGAGATELPGPPPGPAGEPSAGLPPLKNCLFSARKRRTLASRSRQSRRLSFRASCRRLKARSLAITWERAIPNARGADSAGGDVCGGEFFNFCFDPPVPPPPQTKPILEEEI